MERLPNEKLEYAIEVYKRTLEVTRDNGEHCYTPFDEDTLKLLEELKAYRDAEEQGLLLRLPCKVGDTVYIVMRLHYQPNGLDMSQYEEIEEVKVDNVTIGKPYWQINGDEHEFMEEIYQIAEQMKEV